MDEDIKPEIEVPPAVDPDDIPFEINRPTEESDPSQMELNFE